MDLQSIVDAVYSYSSESKFGDRQKLLNYLTNSFDHYVNSVKRPTESIDHDSSPYGVDAHANTLKKRNIYNADKDREKNVVINQMEGNDYASDDDYKEDEDDDIVNEKLGVKKNKFKQLKKNVAKVFRVLCITKGKRFGNYLLALFVFVKILYTTNSVLQLFILNHFLGNDYLLLGVEVFSKIWYGDDWTQLSRFPRVTMCDFRIREVGITHRYTVSLFLSRKMSILF